MIRPALAALSLAVLAACSPRESSTTTTTETVVTHQATAVSSSSSSSAGGPSFDCSKATEASEATVCAQPQLAQMDVELARLYGVVAGDPATTEVERETLKRLQTGWLDKRKACGTTVAAATCLVEAYAGRIHDLRSGYAVARKDGAGLSTGPVSWLCPARADLLIATFVNGVAPIAYVKWGAKSVVLSQAPSASGARYVATVPVGGYELWNKGREVMWSEPGATQVTCKQVE